MSETSGPNGEDKKVRVRCQPKRDSVLTSTCVASRYTVNSGWDDSQNQDGDFLQRQCACGTHTIGGSECNACRRKREASFFQRTATNTISNNVALNTPVEVQTSPELSFAQDFSRVPTHTVAPQTTSTVQTKFRLNSPEDQYEQEAARVVEQMVRWPTNQHQNRLRQPGVIQGKHHLRQRLLTNELVNVVQQSGTNQAINSVMRQSPSQSSEDSKCKLTIGSILPTPDSIAGHAFLRLTGPKGDTLSRGFWPACAKCSDSSLCSFLEFQLIFWSKGPGQVCDDSSERADSEISYDLSRNQYVRLLSFIAKRQKSPPLYSTMSYNCVDFVLEAAKSAGISIPDYFFSGISEPKELAKFIERKKSRIEGKRILDSGNQKLIQKPKGPIDLNVGANFWVEPRPKRIDVLEYRWVIADGKDKRYLMWGPAGSVFQFGAHPSAYIPAKTRNLLKKRGITRATVLCRVQIYYNKGLTHGGNRENALLRLPIAFRR